MTLRSEARVFAIALIAGLLTAVTTFAQSDFERKTIAITYPLDETVTVKFRGTICLAALKGRGKGEARWSSWY